MLRRPLCFGLLFFLAVYLAAVQLLPDEAVFDRENREGQRVQLIGEAAALYEPADGSQEGRSFTLSRVQILNDSDGNRYRETSPDKSTLTKQNKAVICYLAQEEERLPRTGSRVKVEGIISVFEPAKNPGEFDAAAYYERQGVLFSVRKTRILKESRSFHRGKELLYQIRHFTDSFYLKVLGEKDGSIASAMVLGIKKGMDSGQKSLYQRAGIAHLLVVSGLHMSLIGSGLLALLRRLRLPLFAAVPLAALTLYGYGELTGMGVSTRRAVLMFFLMLTARVIKRTRDLPTSLAVAACVILVGNPACLEDAGFQLSFSAVTGAALLVPVLQEQKPQPPGVDKSRFRALGQWIFTGVTASLGITLTMLPFLLCHYYEWNPWSVLANLAVIPLMGILLPLFLLLALAGPLLYAFPAALPLFRLAALPAKGILFLYQWIASMVVQLPGSSLHTGFPGIWQLALYACGLAVLAFLGKKIRPMPRLLLAFCLTGLFMLRLPGPLTVTMLDVGQGEAVCVETPEHQVYLLDAGSTSNQKAGQYQIVPFLKYKGVRRIRGICISHWDQDHVNALADVLTWAEEGGVKVERLYLPDTALWDEALTQLLLLAQSHGISVERVHAGQFLQEGKMRLRCLHPVQKMAAADRNQVSLVWRLEYGDFSALFTGDLEADGEKRLLELYGNEPGGRLDCDLLDAGHHGAGNATTREFLQAVSPGAVFISCGKNNRYGHPAPETLERVKEAEIPCFITARQGALTASVEKKGVKIRGFIREDKKIK